MFTFLSVHTCVVVQIIFFFLALAICLALPFLLSKCVFIEKLWLRWFVGRDEFAGEAKSKREKENKVFIPFT